LCRPTKDVVVVMMMNQMVRPHFWPDITLRGTLGVCRRAFCVLLVSDLNFYPASTILAKLVFVPTRARRGRGGFPTASGLPCYQSTDYRFRCCRWLSSVFTARVASLGCASCALACHGGVGVCSCSTLLERGLRSPVSFFRFAVLLHPFLLA
jgi:hypothetical protein